MSLLKRKSSRPQRKRESQRTSGQSAKSLDCSSQPSKKQPSVANEDSVERGYVLFMQSWNRMVGR
jgi:hypothetical protein